MNAATLLRLLEREDQLIATTLRESNHRVGVGERFGEDWGVYHAHLLEDCLRICSKTDILALLLRNTQSDLVEVRFDATGLLGGPVRQAFSLQQRGMIDSVLGVVSVDRAAMVRSAALGAMAGIATSESPLLPSERSRFHRAAAAAVEDPDPGVRRAAVELLGAVGTASDAGILRDLAQRDPFASVSRGVKSFPIRDAAREALTRLHLQ
jgi:HEAT repeats